MVSSRFYMCDEEGQISAEFLCEDGLVFDPISGQCAQPINIKCPEPLELQEPQPVRLTVLESPQGEA